MKQRLLNTFLFCLLFGAFQSVVAQQVEVKSSIDSVHVRIGDQIRLLLEVEKPKGLDVGFPQVPDTFGPGIEVVRRSAIDTSKLSDQGRERLVQSIFITSFDSGQHQIPPFFFRMRNGQILDSVATRQLMFEVHTMKIDTTKGPVDIKPIYQAPVTLKEAAPYILGIILIAAIIFFAFYYIRWKKKNVPLFVKPEKPAEPAHIIALRELDRIKAQKLWQQEKLKQYYSEVSDTIRTYVQNRFGIPAMEQTSSETISVFREQRNLIDKSALNHLQHILSLADLVKFAKYSPLPDDNNLTLANAYLFVGQTKKEETKVTEKQTGQIDKNIETETSEEG